MNHIESLLKILWEKFIRLLQEKNFFATDVIMYLMNYMWKKLLIIMIKILFKINIVVIKVKIITLNDDFYDKII